jgi:hypothetical protein
MKTRTHFPALKVLFASLVVGLMCGCSGSFAPSAVQPDEIPIGNIQGAVHGGQNPVVGAQIYLFAASTAGYGHLSTSLITSGKTGVTCNNSGTLNGDCYVTTDSNGNFALAGDYTCTQGTQVYMAAVGGNPGLSQPGALPFSTTATFKKQNPTITVTSATGITVGLAVTGGKLAAGTTVTGVSGTTITISQDPTGNENQGETVTFSTTTATVTSGSATITVASAANVATGYLVGGNGLGGTVTAVNGLTLTLSQNATATGTNVPVTFTVPPAPINNAAIVQMAAPGQCPMAGNLAAQVPYLVINEVTTVAMAYSMSGFGSDAFHIGSDATGATALGNAIANANNIVNIQYGQAPTVANGNPNSINPQAKLYTLAGVVAQCVNSSSPSSSNCTSLFNLAKNSAGTAPTDESTALFNIAQNQGQNALAIYNLLPSTPVFSPTLTKAPSDWTMPVIYTNIVSLPSTGTGAITSGPYNLVFDLSGNAWIGDRANGVIKISPQGAVTTFSNAAKGFGMVKGVAISPRDGSIWVSDYNNNDVVVMDASGTKLTTLTIDLGNNGTIPTANGPILTAFARNPAGTGYLAHEANETNTGVVTFDAGSYALDNFESSTNYGNIDTPGWISVDQKGAVWIPSTDSAFIGGLAVTDNNSAMTYAASQPGGFGASYTTGADGNGNVWVATNGGTTLYEVSSGTKSATLTGGGMNEPFKLVIDGSNTVWIANAGVNTVSAWSTGSGAWLGVTNVGFSTGAGTAPAPGRQTGCVVIGVDPSGNVWTGNGDQSVTQLLGLGTPTAAPFYGGSTVISSTGVTTTTPGNLGSKP